MTTISVQDAQANLSDLVHGLAPGEEVLLTENNQLVARLIAAAAPATYPRQLGTLRGTVLHMAADFDAPLEDFEEYMQ